MLILILILVLGTVSDYLRCKCNSIITLPPNIFMALRFDLPKLTRHLTFNSCRKILSY